MTWRRSTFCATDQATEQCVEVDAAAWEVFVRDSKDPGRVLVFSAAEWDAFLLGVKAGQFDLTHPSGDFGRPTLAAAPRHQPQGRT